MAARPASLGPSLEAVNTSFIKASTVASPSESKRKRCFVPDTTRVTLRYAFHELGNKLLEPTCND